MMASRDYVAKGLKYSTCDNSENMSAHRTMTFWLLWGLKDLVLMAGV